MRILEKYGTGCLLDYPYFKQTPRQNDSIQ